MAQGPGFALSLGIILAAVLIAVATTMFPACPTAGSDSAEVIYRPQHLLVY
jgi:hypothetical protein